MKSSITAIILTWNEEANLGRCLESVIGLAGEMIVVDSHSTDGTAEIAEKYGAKIVEHDFKNQADQFNWALDNLDIKGDWVLKLDADEYLTPELAEEIASVISSAPVANGYYMKRRVYFMGRWMKHGGYYPAWFLRLWKTGKARMEEKEMDEHAVLMEGKAGYLKNDFADDNRKGLTDWVNKHNKYASREAKDFVSGFYASGGKKSLYYRLPPYLRSFLYFCYRYFIRLGFLDGVPGLAFHFLQGFWYRFLIDSKIYELLKQERIKTKKH